MTDRHQVTADLLKVKYGSSGEHEKWPARGWKLEVQNGDTRLGYWEWVAKNINAANANAKTKGFDFCDHCGLAKEDVYLRTNPYQHDVKNKEEADCQELLCDECYNDLLGAI